MTDIIIREATLEDAGVLSELIKSSMANYRDESGIKGDVLESLTESKDSIIQRIQTQHCLCAELNGEIIGTITISLCENPLKYSFSDRTYGFLLKRESCAYISRFAVASKSRNTGIGNKLMDKALLTSEVVDSGIVLLHTAVSNRYMKDFYFNRGFELLDSENSRGYERGLFYKLV